MTDGMLPAGEERFRVLFERSPVGMALVAVDGTVLAANPAACRLLGRGEEELVGSLGVDLVHPDERQPAAEQLRRLLDGEVDEARVERRFLRPDGTVVWTDAVIQAVRTKSGTLHLQVVLLDITERRKAEEARAWLAAVVESSVDAIVGITLDGKILNWNSGAQAIFGYSAEEMIGQNASILRRPGVQAEAAVLTGRFEAGERLERRVERIRKTGAP